MSSLSGKNSSSVSIPQRVASIFVFATRLHNTYTVYENHQEKSHFQFLFRMFQLVFYILLCQNGLKMVHKLSQIGP